MFDGELAIDLRQAAEIAGVHPSTPMRWIRHGVLGPSGNRVRLGAQKVGARWRTSRESLTRFANAMTPKAEE